jgi:hypothetical protein
MKDAREAEQKRSEQIVREYLVFNSQRAVSWHEVQDCLGKIRSGEPPFGEKG